MSSAGGIRRRAVSATRLEAFTDAAFAFAVTLLVIAAGDLPRSVEDLSRDLRGIPAFAASFAIVAFFWHAHYQWSRRYGLETTASVLLTLALVFCVLIWVYPLRMVTAAALMWITGGWANADFTLRGPSDLALVFIAYSVGFGLLSMICAALYRHAAAQSAVIGLSAAELAATRQQVRHWWLLATIALVSLALALALRDLPLAWYSATPGLVYALIGPALWVLDRVSARPSA